MTLSASRLGRRTSDLRVVQRATLHIDELNARLDGALAVETSESERMRLLREATNQITRAANDGIQAYRRVVGALKSEAARPDSADADALGRVQAALDAARTDLLRAIAATSERYPWAVPGATAETAPSRPTSRT